MKRDGRCGAGRDHALQEPRRIVRRRAEFAGKFQHRAAQRRCDAHEDAQAFATAGFRQQLVQLEIAINDEVAHIVFLERDLRRTRRAHRRHEMALRFRITLVHEFDLSSDAVSKCADARAIDLVQHMQRRIGLHGIKRVAGKRLDKPLRRDAELLRKDHIDGIDRLQLSMMRSIMAKRGSASVCCGVHVHGPPGESWPLNGQGGGSSGRWRPEMCQFDFF